MAQQTQRVLLQAADDRRESDRARLLERVAVGLAHEGKNPLHNMALHLQLMAEKLGAAPVEKHLAALRDGIGRVDALLNSFGDFASPEHLPADLGAAAARAVQLFAYDSRRAGVQLVNRGPPGLLVASHPRSLGDLVAHALVAALELSREGGTVHLGVRQRGDAAVLEVHAAGGMARRDLAEPHLDALRRLAAEAACELSLETPPAGGARLSLSFLLTR